MKRRPFEQGRFADLPELPRRTHRYYDAEAIELDVDSDALGPTRVHVRRHGTGPPLLLVHGLMTSSYSWRYAFDRLGRHFTCYAPDLPSNGRSGHASARYTPRALAAWLAEVQRALGIRGCAVIGNSMGGYLCMVWALDDPEAMTSLVNLHSPGVPEIRLSALKLALAIPGVPAILRAAIRRNPLRWAHRNVHYYDESLKSLEEAREYGDPLRTREGANGLIKYLRETMDVAPMRAFQTRLRTLRETGQPFPVPLLLVYAERDPMVPPKIGDDLAAAIPSATLVRLPEASHFAHVDATDRFVDAVLPWLDRDHSGSHGPSQ